jgi:hypothetical protein
MIMSDGLTAPHEGKKLASTKVKVVEIVGLAAEVHDGLFGVNAKATGAVLMANTSSGVRF